MFDVDSEWIIKFVNEVVYKAITENASDIHIEPKDDFVQVRFKKDGVFSIPEGYNDISKQLHESIVARIKVLTNTMKLDVVDKPQNGEMNLLFSGERRLFKVSTLPTQQGENVVINVLPENT